MVERLTAQRKARRAVGHNPMALSFADRAAKIGFTGQAEFTLAALRRVQGNHVIPGDKGRHTGTDLPNDAGAFVTQNRRENTFRITA